MAKKEVSCACPVCNTDVCKLCALVAVVIGVCFLLQDLAIWNFWNLSWYTVAFLMIGLGSLFGISKK